MAIPISFSFDVFARKDVGAPPSIPDAPPWLNVAVHRQAQEPALFSIPEDLAAALDPKLRSGIAQSKALYRVTVAPKTRPEEDAHLQYGIQVAAELAEAVQGVVLDRLARRALDAESFGATCAPEVENHVTYASSASVARSAGMAKFGLAEVALPLEVVGGDAETGLQVLDAICSGLVAGIFTIDRPFKLAGATWRLAPEGASLLASPM